MADISQWICSFHNTDFDYIKGMKTFRIVLGILAVIPLALLADKFFLHPIEYDEDSLKMLIFVVLGIPILIFNLWAWIYPEIIDNLFWSKE
jgi:hypothetical protein